MSESSHNMEEALLVLLSSERDAGLVSSRLAQANIQTRICGSVIELAAELRRGAGAILLAEEELTSERSLLLKQVIDGQPAWSDIPLIVLCHDPSSPRWSQISGNILLVERPVRFRALESVVHVALRARRRQYQLRAYAAQQEREAELRRGLWEAASVLLTTEEPEAMLRGIFARIGPTLQLDVFLNFMEDEIGRELRLVSYGGISPEEAVALSQFGVGWPVGVGRRPGSAQAAAESGEPFSAASLQHSCDPALAPLQALGIRAVACHPLRSGPRLWGTLWFGSRRKDSFAADELEFLRTISHYLTVAYERSRLVKELREGDRRKDVFLATLAHELRNPLAPLRNALELLRLAGDRADVRAEACEMMDRQLVHTVRLVDDLLDVSRITREKLELKPALIDLRSVVQAAVETSRPLLEARGHTLTLSVPERPLPVFGDATRLAQVFANLLNNAAKYTDPGGEVSLRVAVCGEELEVTVADNGIGIPAEMLHGIFDMFMQVGRAEERSQGGLGIGLTLAKQLLEKHGGTIAAHSEGPNRGSRFVVRLPLAKAAQEQAASPAASSNGAFPQRRILVADDNVDSARSLGAMLRAMGHEVQTAFDGAEAVERAKAFRPDVAILDIGMPQLNGYDAARRLRSEFGDDCVHLIALTGWGQEEDKRKSRAAGFHSHLTKPVHVPLLLQVLETHPAEKTDRSAAS